MGLAKEPRKTSLPGRVSDIPLPVTRLMGSGSVPLHIQPSPPSRRYSLVQWKTATESSNGTCVNGGTQSTSSTSGQHLNSTGSAVKQPQTQSASRRPCTKTGSESSVNQRSLSTSSATHPKPSEDKRRTQSTNTRTPQGIHAMSTSGSSRSGSDIKYATQDSMQVDGGDGKQVPDSKLVTSMMDRVRTTSTLEKV